MIIKKKDIAIPITNFFFDSIIATECKHSIMPYWMTGELSNFIILTFHVHGEIIHDSVQKVTS